ncbi:hypothetical protein X425_01084 [Mycobacterium avium XTB13-223]|jgi:hypothetical protein|nr:hypothetical protein X425_01084 [Mycobacterium avium XTB13-223]
MSRTGTGGSGIGDHIRRPLDMDQLGAEASEFSWGPGLTPQALEQAAPSEGGRYRGTSPPNLAQVNISRQ